MADNFVKFRKIPLKLLLDTLTHIYNSGADFIDILGETGSVQDVVTIAVEQEYMNDPTNDTPDDVHFTNDKLSDEDIDNLLQ
jgi:hypothetical protein